MINSHKIKKFSSVIIGASLFSISLLASAADLKFANDTNNNLSVRIKSVCSPLFGVIGRHTEKVIAEANLKEACGSGKCLMQVFNTANCTGTNVENIILDMKIGIVSLEGGDDDDEGNRYFWRADAFNLYVSNH